MYDTVFICTLSEGGAQEDLLKDKFIYCLDTLATLKKEKHRNIFNVSNGFSSVFQMSSEFYASNICRTNSNDNRQIKKLGTNAKFKRVKYHPGIPQGDHTWALTIPHTLWAMSNLWTPTRWNKRYRFALVAAVVFTVTCLYMLAVSKSSHFQANRITVSEQACSSQVTENKDLLPYAACHLMKQVLYSLRLIHASPCLTPRRLGILLPLCMVSEHKMSTIRHQKIKSNRQSWE